MADSKKLRGGLGDGSETVIISTVEEVDQITAAERKGPKPAAKPGRVPPPVSGREVNTLKIDEDGDAEPDEVRAADAPKAEPKPRKKAKPVAPPVTDDTAEHAALSETVVIPTPPGLVTPIDAATREAVRYTVWQRMGRVAVVMVLAFPALVFVTSLAFMPLTSALYVLGGVGCGLLFVGPMIKDAIQDKLFKVVTARLWIEAVAAVAMIFGLVVFSGEVWQWFVTVALISLILRAIVESARRVNVGGRSFSIMELREGN